MIEVILIIIISGTAILYYYIQNRNKRIERFFIRNDKTLYGLLQLSYFILSLGVIFNIRYIVYKYIIGKNI